MSTALAKGIRIGLIVLLFMPLIVTENQTIFPHAVGKAIFARSLIELLLAAWIMLVIVDPTYRPRRSLVILTFGVYALVSLFAAVFGVSFTKSLWSEYGRMMGVWDLFHWFFFVLIAASVVRTARQWHFLLNWVLVVALILSAIALGQAYDFSLPFLPPSVDRHVDRVDATLGNASFLAAILAVTSLLALGFLSRSLLKPDPEEEETPAHAARDRGPRLPRGKEERHLRDQPHREQLLLQLRRLFWIATIVLGVWALFLTGTRGALAGLIAGLITVPIALAVWGNRRVAGRLAVPFVGVLLSIIMVAVIVEVADFRFGRGDIGSDVFARLGDTSRQDGSLGPRLTSGRIALQSFADRPILGWGPENFSAAFNRYVNAEFFETIDQDVDQAHISVLEQLASRGLLGAAAFVAMWAAVFRGVLKRRRSPREEVFAYAILGGLVAYFIQNLVLFDTPATILIWAVLVAWVASQKLDREPAIAPAATASSRRRGARQGEPAQSLLASPWGLGGIALVVIALLTASLTFLNQRPYTSAETILDTMRPGVTWTQRLDLYQESFDNFPDLANRSRQALFEKVAREWEDLSPAEKTQALRVLDVELERGLEAEPHNSILLLSAIVLYQKAVAAPGDAARIDPLLRRLSELAPERLQTHQRLATQAVLKGNPRQALAIIEAYLVKAPGTEPQFKQEREFAEDILESLSAS